MNAPLSLRSIAGKGTVFTLEVPVGRPRPAPALPARSSAPLGLTLDRRLVVMIEDDPAVQSGLEVLLKSWGASVISFDSVQACQQWVQAAEPTMLQPDLIIADYRLESGHTGVEAIRALRGMLDRPIPAIVVTGSVLSNHEREAARARLPPAAETGGAGQAARDDRVQAGLALEVPFSHRASCRTSASPTLHFRCARWRPASRFTPSTQACRSFISVRAWFGSVITPDHSHWS